MLIGLLHSYLSENEESAQKYDKVDKARDKNGDKAQPAQESHEAALLAALLGRSRQLAAERADFSLEFDFVIEGDAFEEQRDNDKPTMSMTGENEVKSRVLKPELIAEQEIAQHNEQDDLLALMDS